jgi:hypothetical protein
MNFSLRPHQLIAHWIPGFVVLCICFVCDLHYNFGYLHRVQRLLENTENKSVFLEKSIVVLVFAAAVLTLGQFLDALRDIIEWLLHRRPGWKIRWEKIAAMKPERLAAWDDFFFSYYVFSANLTIGIFVVFLFLALNLSFHMSWGKLLVHCLVVALVFGFDAYILRCDVRIILNETKDAAVNDTRQEPATPQKAEGANDAEDSE